jgi:hypothetical protein
MGRKRVTEKFAGFSPERRAAVQNATKMREGSVK